MKAFLLIVSVLSLSACKNYKLRHMTDEELYYMEHGNTPEIPREPCTNRMLCDPKLYKQYPNYGSMDVFRVYDTKKDSTYRIVVDDGYNVALDSTVIIVTHKYKNIKNFDKLLEFKNGDLVEKI